MTVAELIAELQKYPQDLEFEVGCVESSSNELTMDVRNRWENGVQLDQQYLAIHHL